VSHQQSWTGPKAAGQLPYVVRYIKKGLIMSDLFGKIPFEKIVDEPKKSKGPIQMFFDKWCMVIFCFFFSLFFFGLGIYATFSHYPELTELRHVNGELNEYSIIDAFRNHRITLMLKSGEVFKFKKVPFFPRVKSVIARGSQVDVWVDDSKTPEIWQLSINGMIMMSRDAIVARMKDIGWAFKAGLYLLLAGCAFLMMIKSKSKFISGRLYPATMVGLVIVCMALYFYFAFYKGGLLGK